MSTTAHQLLLLADHLKLSLLERQRAIALNLEPNKHDNQISRSLTSLQEGIDELDSQEGYSDEADESSDLAKLKVQFANLYAQFHGSAPPSRSTQEPNDPSLTSDFTAAKTLDTSRRIGNKNVRFRDNPSAEDPVEAANRASLFAETSQYRDEPDQHRGPDQSQLDNQQIHAYHSQVLREQDEQLEILGQSVGRQRLLGMQMGGELEEQAELLDDVERGVDRHSTILDRASKRLSGVAKKSKDNWNWLTIGILIVVLLLLIIILK